MASKEWPSIPKAYELITPLGLGTFGIVWKAKVLEGSFINSLVAIKILDLEKCTDYKIEEIRRKMLLLNMYDHKNILDYKISFIAGNEIWLVSQIMEMGSVESVLKSIAPKGFQDMNLVATILRETLQGLEYLHEQKQIHRDIKAANILLQKDGNICISDFSFLAKNKKNKKRFTLVGSPCWMAPEVMDDQGGGYDNKVDIWSFGITAIELVTGRPPYSELETMKVILKIVNDPPPRLDKKQGFDENLLELINACLEKDPKNRKTAAELLKMKFFSKAKGKDYIIENLYKNLPSIEERIPESVKNMAADEKAIKKKDVQSIKWDFKLSETEPDFKSEDKSKKTQEKSPEKEKKLTKDDLSQTVKLSQSYGDFSEFANLEEEEK